MGCPKSVPKNRISSCLASYFGPDGKGDPVITFELSADQKMAQSAMQEFAQSALRPVARRQDTESRIAPETLAALWDAGIVQSQSGDDDTRSAVLNAIVLEELAVGDTTLALALAAPMAFVQAVIDHGSPAQHAALLPLFEGPKYQAAAIALLEAGFGADVTQPRTAAIETDKGWRLDGRKTLVPLAGSCSHFLVIASVADKCEAFIVERGTPGVRVEPAVPTVGLRALGMADVVFDGVRLPASARLGEGDGSNVQRIIDSSRAGLAAVMTGLTRGVMEYVIPYTKDRQVFGTALARKQVIAFRIADMHIDVNAMRWMVWRAATELEKGSDATRSAMLAYTFAAQQTMAIADEGVQALGGHGYVRAHPIEMWYRDARAISMLEGMAGV
jgi:alkylation response protein AidB-like acyl-CoA dehydrogenase